jgi:Holliday junction resolvase RusA-like endonuclease
MKISRKLSDNIQKEILDARNDILFALDEKDRKEQISHEIWQELYKIVLDKTSEMYKGISREIETYSGKR